MVSQADKVKMKKPPKMKPCPFCGLTDTRLENTELSADPGGEEDWEKSGYELWFVICGCVAQGPATYLDHPCDERDRADAKYDAIIQWNRRITSATPYESPPMPENTPPRKA